MRSDIAPRLPRLLLRSGERGRAGRTIVSNGSRARWVKHATRACGRVRGWSVSVTGSPTPREAAKSGPPTAHRGRQHQGSTLARRACWDCNGRSATARRRGCSLAMTRRVCSARPPACTSTRSSCRRRRCPSRAWARASRGRASCRRSRISTTGNRASPTIGRLLAPARWRRMSRRGCSTSGRSCSRSRSHLTRSPSPPTRRPTRGPVPVPGRHAVELVGWQGRS